MASEVIRTFTGDMEAQKGTRENKSWIIFSGGDRLHLRGFMRSGAQPGSGSGN